MIRKFLLIITLVTSPIYGASLESVDETDLLHMIKGENPVVVLFTKNNCAACEKYEVAIENLQVDLKENLNADVVKISNSPMVSIYDPTKEPALIMFRKGIPLLYHGNVNEDEILMHFSENREPVAKELSDANFEHLTQAATGATTGDWFIFFYSSECVPCQRLYAIWEAVAANLKSRMNVARVNRKESGIATAKRFKIEKAPEFIFIRQGKFYRYKSSEYTPKDLIKFAEQGYAKEVSAETVPAVNDPMADIVSLVKEFIAANPNLVIYGALGLAIILVGVNCALFLTKKKKTKDDQKSKKK
ncbi:thioredoxin domain-containing protein [Condylostylus longicornis]|uniref:thioredoxin domain-containing protein n=1 Tax=Condylostylus longicornis TaxID=2530218 RepID=UPI00244DEBE1|nr:thioredoxin domain-containing protein [Condylostylus longicornis]